MVPAVPCGIALALDLIGFGALGLTY